MTEAKRRSAASLGNGADANDKELSLGAQQTGSLLVFCCFGHVCSRL
jgi:hypothetical protein